MNSNSKSIWKVVLTIARYVIAVALGYVSGDGEVFNLINDL